MAFVLPKQRVLLHPPIIPVVGLVPLKLVNMTYNTKIGANFVSLQVRKFRTLTEIIHDTEEHVKHPYKGKKLKVSSVVGQRTLS